MNRRKFLHQAGWLTAGTCMLPVMLPSCKPSDWQEENLFQGDVIIIGAGIAGLYAAEMLINQGISVQILESTSNWGGRLRSFPIASNSFHEAQKRTIRGEFSILSDLVRHQNISLTEKSGSEMYYFNGALNTESEANQNTFFQEMLQTVESLQTFDGADITAQAYFDALGISSNVENVYNVLAGQVHGTSADRIGALGIARQNRQWSSGNKEYAITTSELLRAVERALPKALGVIQYNSSITSIDYSEGKVSMEDSTGMTYTCDRLLITLPLDVLQSGAISFTPALDNHKLNAISHVRIDMCYCAMFKLQAALWPIGTRRIIGNDIVQSFEVDDEGWVYAEVSGTQAENVASIFGEPLNIIQVQFDQLFPGALDQITDSAIQQWGGNRSYDPVGIGNARDAIASSVGSKLFFAGEATHTGGHHGTMHGAMETALRAVTELLQGGAA
jgi:monoamine oxidase